MKWFSRFDDIFQINLPWQQMRPSARQTITCANLIRPTVCQYVAAVVIALNCDADYEIMTY